MFRKILLGTGSMVLILLFSLWIYLLVFSSPGNALEQWFNGVTIEPTPITDTTDQNPVSQLAPITTALSQLSTKSVAAFGIVQVGTSSASTTPQYRLRYAETGTGHVYEIDLEHSTETRISGVTVAKTVGAVFDPAGAAFVLTAERGNDTESILYAFGNSEPKQQATFPTDSRDFHFTDNGRLRYTDIENDHTVAYELDWQSGKTVTLWNIPLTQIDVAWTDNGAIIVNKLAGSLKGGVYSIDRDILTRLVAPHPSLTAIASDDGELIWYSAYDAGIKQIVSTVLDRTTGETHAAPLQAIPEKCFISVTQKKTCAIAAWLLSPERGDLDRWYRGELISDDRLWEETDGGAAYTANLSELAGQTIDVTDIKPAPDNSFYFINKTTRTLWRYRLDG